MQAASITHKPLRDQILQFGALAGLVVIGGLALFGPSGVLAWGEDAARLTAHEGQIALLQERQEVLENRRKLLDPAHVDPDLASELVRRDLNVAHPDEFVMELDGQP